MLYLDIFAIDLEFFTKKGGEGVSRNPKFPYQEKQALFGFLPNPKLPSSAKTGAAKLRGVLKIHLKSVSFIDCFPNSYHREESFNEGFPGSETLTAT